MDRNDSESVIAMPYRAPADFSWEPIHRYPHARRVVAALVLVLVGWATGFFAGRMSAWLFPVIGSDTAALTGTLERSSPRAAGPPVQITAVPPTPQPADDKQKTAAAAPAPLPPAAPAPVAAPSPAPAAAPASEISAEQSRPKEDPPAAPRRDVTKADPKSPAPPDMARKTEALVQEETRGPRSAVVLVNPEWTRARPIPPQRELEEERDRESMYDGAGIAECESRYSSFRRSDGTYQPYGRSSREFCPYLR